MLFRSGQVNVFRSIFNQTEGNFLNILVIADQSKDAAVVASVRRVVQKGHARHALSSFNQAVDDCLIAAFRKVRNTFNNFCHKILPRDISD